MTNVKPTNILYNSSGSCLLPSFVLNFLVYGKKTCNKSLIENRCVTSKVAKNVVDNKFQAFAYATNEKLMLLASMKQQHTHTKTSNKVWRTIREMSRERNKHKVQTYFEWKSIDEIHNLILCEWLFIWDQWILFKLTLFKNKVFY